MNYGAALIRFTDSIRCTKCRKKMIFENLVSFEDMPIKEGQSFTAARALCCTLSHEVKATFLNELEG